MILAVDESFKVSSFSALDVGGRWDRRHRDPGSIPERHQRADGPSVSSELDDLSTDVIRCGHKPHSRSCELVARVAGSIANGMKCLDNAGSGRVYGRHRPTSELDCGVGGP